MTLADVQTGALVTIRAITLSSSRLQAIRLGLSPGTLVKVVQQLPKGPVIVEISNRKIAVGRQLAQQIEVGDL